MYNHVLVSVQVLSATLSAAELMIAVLIIRSAQSPPAKCLILVIIPLINFYLLTLEDLVQKFV